jgi:hypothetical protein
MSQNSSCTSIFGCQKLKLPPDAGEGLENIWQNPKKKFEKKNWKKEKEKMKKKIWIFFWFFWQFSQSLKGPIFKLGINAVTDQTCIGQTGIGQTWGLFIHYFFSIVSSKYFWFFNTVVYICASLLHLAVESHALYKATLSIENDTYDHFERKKLSFCKFAQLVTIVIFLSDWDQSWVSTAKWSKLAKLSY